MVKFIKPVLFSLIVLWVYPAANCQDSVNIIEYLSKKFEKYCDAVPWEEVFIHTDREEYIAGEDMWFNTYIIDRQSNKLSDESKILYFELLNPENRTVVQKRIMIENGLVPGQVTLPDTLSTGVYNLRAYTRWMKNFLPDNCFMKEINIYNAISNKIYKRRSFSGTDKLIEAEAIPFSGIDEDGFSLEADNLKPDIVEILIKTNNNFRSVNGNHCYLFIQTHGIRNHVRRVTLSGNMTEIVIFKNSLIPGINQITLFDSKAHPIAERYIYTPSKDKEDFLLRVPEISKTRSRMIIEIEMEKESVSLLNNTNLSISLAPLTNPDKIIGLKDYLVTGSEYGIVPWDIVREEKNIDTTPRIPDAYLKTLKSKWIDWDIILSDKGPSLKYNKETDSHFLSGRLFGRNPEQNVSGKYIFMSTPGEKADFQYARTDNEGDFNFTVPINNELQDLVIQPEEIISSNYVNIESSFSEEYIPFTIFDDSAQMIVPPYISMWSANYQVSKIYGSSYVTWPNTIAGLSEKPVRFYGRPDIELIMDDYIKLPVMEEVFFELIPGASLKKRRSGYEISIVDPVTNRIYNIPPVLFIDGVVIDDPGIIANLDPEIVEQIDVVKERYMVGDYLFYGLANVITRTGDYSSVSLPDYAVRLSYRVTEPVNIFQSPDYSSADMKHNRIPDFRNTLFWNPSVKPDTNGKAGIEFWSSDYNNDYLINIQGMTTGGEIITLKKIITIKKDG